MSLKWTLIVLSLCLPVFSQASDGDDAGNGGFAYKQSRKILRMAAAELVGRIENSRHADLLDNLKKREILQTVLAYENIIQLPKAEEYRGGKLLAFDYVIEPISVKVYKPFFIAFSGTLNDHLEQASLEVQTRLVHEASHIWGLNEEEAEEFALEFMGGISYEHRIPYVSNMHRYTCIQRSGSYSGGDNEYTSSVRMHFNYNENSMPSSLPFGNRFLFCHDVQRYGENDNPLFPRLEDHRSNLIWSNQDPLFFDLNQNGKRDILDNINYDLEIAGHSPLRRDAFRAFQISTSPISTESTIGFYLRPFINNYTVQSFCPKSADYQSSNKLMQVLGKHIEVNTEALYRAKREPVILYDDNGNAIAAPDDFLYLSKSEIEKVWFYYENGAHYQVDPSTQHRKTLRFYWPIDIENPYVKKAAQKMYTIVPDDGAYNLATDKRIGCVPSLDERSIPPRNNNCSSDFQCSSLCCDNSAGVCKSVNEEEGLFCSKPVGQSCVSSNFCKSENVRSCGLYFTGTAPSGELSCSIRCFTEMKHGQCKNNICEPSPALPIPSFDPANPDCSEAKPYPSL